MTLVLRPQWWWQGASHGTFGEEGEQSILRRGDSSHKNPIGWKQAWWVYSEKEGQCNCNIIEADGSWWWRKKAGETFGFYSKSYFKQALSCFRSEGWHELVICMDMTSFVLHLNIWGTICALLLCKACSLLGLSFREVVKKQL